MTYTLHHGDCLEVMRGMAANSVDTVVTDPPYGLSFMGKNWDHGVPGAAFWAEALRVAKPGAMLLAFGGTRTYHRLTVVIEDAGWEIRDCLMWLYGSGFPKSADISKHIDKAAGAEREIVGIGTHGKGSYSQGMSKATGFRPYVAGLPSENNNGQHDITAPATDAAPEWAGWGTALKPAWEPIILAMKPLDGTFAQNAQTWGVAGLNIDGGRIPITDGATLARNNKPGDNGWKNSSGGPNAAALYGEPAGRWPANLLLDEAAAAALDAQSGERPSGGGNKSPRKHDDNLAYGRGLGWSPNPSIGGDTGGASRFFKVVASDKYCALCDMLMTQKHGIMNGTQSHSIGGIPCNSVASAESNSSQNGKGSSIAVGLAVPQQQQNGAGKSEELPLFASSVGVSSQNSQATNGCSAPSNAKWTAIAQNAQSAKYAESLCDSCVTAIAQSIAAMSQGETAASIHFPVSIPEHKRQILIDNLALFVEHLGSTGTIPTTPSLNLLFGSVLHAIAESTKQESSEAPGKSHPARFLYQSKASRSERNAGLEGMEARHAPKLSGGEFINPLTGSNNKTVMRENHHPTVKPLELMRYLVRLTSTPTGGVVLDPFMGSGTTGVACMLEGRSFVGIDKEAEYVEIARRRIMAAELPLMREAAD